MSLERTSPRLPLRQERFWVGVVLAAALLLRIVLYVQLAESPFARPAGLDEAYYHEAASRLAAGEGLETPFFMSPLYQLLVGGVYAVLPGGLWAVRVLQSLLGLATLLLVYSCARKLLPPWWPLGVLIAAALYHQLFFFETLLLPATLAVFLLTLAVWLALGQRSDPDPRRAALLGVVLGLGVLTHPALVPPAVALGVYLVLGGLRRRRRHALRHGAILFGAAILVVAPVTLANSLAEGRLTPLTTSGGLNIYLSNQPGAQGLYRPLDAWVHLDPAPPGTEGQGLSAGEADAWWWGRFGELLREDPGRIVGLGLRRALLYLNAYEYPQNENYYFQSEFVPLLRLPWLGLHLLLPLGLCGLALSRRRGARLLAVVALAYLLGLLPFFVTARFRVVIAPLLILGAGLAVHRLARLCVLLRRRRGVPRRLRLGLVLAALLLTAATWAALRRPPQIRAFDNRAVGYANLASAAQREADYDVAAALYERALAENPAFTPARLSLARIQLELGGYGPALETLRSADAFGLDPVEASLLTARAYRGLGRPTEALGILQGALRRHEGSYRLNLELAGLYLELGDRHNARVHARRALELEPDSRAARLLLTQAEGRDEAALHDGGSGRAIIDDE